MERQQTISGEEEAEAELVAGAELGYAIRQRGYRFPSSGYIQGTVEDLAAAIPVASVTKERLGDVAEFVADRIDKGAKALEGGMSQEDCERVAREVYQRSALTGFRTVLVLWFDAMIVQSHLRRCGTQGVDELPLPNEVMPTQLTEAWRGILRANWHSIFAPAVQVLENTTRIARGATSEALSFLLEAVEKVEVSRLGDHVSVGAELFPKISEDRKTAAAFYTTPTTAELLVALTIRPCDQHDWPSSDLFRSLRVADLACGTGTLLRAAYRRVRTIHEARGGHVDSLSRIHKDAMEQGIKGADVSPISAHLANSSLAAMGNGEPYGKTHIGWLSVGVPVANAPGQRSTGSLEFLRQSEVNDLFDDLGGATGGARTEDSSIVVLDHTLDYILMNPPYSRTRGGQRAFDISGLTDDEREGCQRRWGALLADQPAIKTAGMAASFLCVARKKTKIGGRIGVVLPLTAAFADTWRETRAMVVRDFDEIIVIAVAGAEGGADALSADTHMGEMLLVAKRRRAPRVASANPIRCVTLRRMYSRHGEAAEVARSITTAVSEMSDLHKPVMAGDEEIGQVAIFQPAAGEPWSHLGVLHDHLALAAKRLADDGVLSDMDGADDMPLPVCMTTIGDLFSVGPTHHLIGNTTDSALELTSISRKADLKGRNRALWNADAKSQTCLLVHPTHKGTVSNQQTYERIRAKTGTLHYARGMRWTSQALLAASTERKVFGGRAWTSLLYDDVRLHKAFALWANSTLGLIVHWTQASRTQSGRATTQVGAITAMPTPDLALLGDAQLSVAENSFDQLARKRLKPACQAHTDPTRAEIDDAVIAMLELPYDRATAAVDTLRRLWCEEPTVHGRNKRALDLLADKENAD